MRINENSPFRKENQPVRRSRPFFPHHHYKPGNDSPSSHIRVDGRETLRRHAGAYEKHLRDEAARMERTGRRAA
jgi:hypothetical protein